MVCSCTIQVDLNGGNDDDEPLNVFCTPYSTVELLKGCFIRATIKYITLLSAKNISKQLLINENIINPTSDVATLDPEDVTIANYRFRIDSALYLLQTWCRQPTSTPGFDMMMPPVFTPTEYGGVSLEQVATALRQRQHRFEMWERSPRPMVDSILPPGMSVQQFYDYLGDVNYSVDRIPMTLPPVLNELKLRGLHALLANKGELDYEHAQEIVSFLDKVMPYVQVNEFLGEDAENTIVKELRDLFASCPDDGHVTIC